MVRHDALSADLLLINGRVLTMDAHDSVAQAMAVRDGKIVAMGATAAIEPLSGASTEQGFPFRTLWDAGFPLSFGSDAPGYYPVDPLRDLGTAVAHQTLSGQKVTAGEELTMREALRSQTINAAYTAFQEQTLGSIEVGKLADIIVLGDDPLTFAPERFWELPVDLTIYRTRFTACP